jgi:hypothetical protein
VCRPELPHMQIGQRSSLFRVSGGGCPHPR